MNRYLKDQQSVKDVLQECYIKLWEKLETVQDDHKIMPMLRTWAIHITINAVRKTAKDAERAYHWLGSQDTTDVADKKLYLGETIAHYRQAVNELPAQQRLVFSLTREEGLSHKEVAERLQVSVYTVKRHLYDAIRTLRTKIPETTLAGIFIVAELQMKLV